MEKVKDEPDTKEENQAGQQYKVLENPDGLFDTNLPLLDPFLESIFDNFLDFWGVSGELFWRSPVSTFVENP